MGSWRRFCLLATALVLIGCGASIQPGNAGLKYRALKTPALGTTIYGPGYYPLWSWNRMVIYDVTTQSQTMQIHVLTKDNLHVPATVTVTYHPDRSKLFQLHTEIGPNYYDELIGPAFVTAYSGRLGHPFRPGSGRAFRATWAHRSGATG